MYFAILAVSKVLVSMFLYLPSHFILLISLAASRMLRLSQLHAKILTDDNRMQEIYIYSYRSS